jgi:hypothetical protein
MNALLGAPEETIREHRALLDETAEHRSDVLMRIEEGAAGLRELDERHDVIERRLRTELDGLVPMLNELRAAGASEGEKPEALRPMVEAEEKLRTAIFPPLVSVMTYLAIVESWAWAVGLVFAGHCSLKPSPGVSRRAASQTSTTERWASRR